MRYVIIGAGAIGGVLGARLFQHSPDRPPLLVSRGEHGAALARDGLRLRTYEEDSVLRVEVAHGPERVRLRDDDVLVLTTKTQQARTALEQWVGQDVFDDAGARVGTAGDCLPILTATNGVENERLALRLFARVYGVCVWLPSVQLVPGEVILRIGPSSGTFIIGRYGRAVDDADREFLQCIHNDWTAGTFTMRVVENVMRWKYEKLLSNLANAVQALVGADQDFGAIAGRLWAEGEAVFQLAGVESAAEAEEIAWRGDDFTIREIPGVIEELGGSSWQSLARGSDSIETDYLNGEIVLLAREHGGAAPLNQAVQGLIRAAVAAGAGVGSMTIAELEAALDAAV